VTQDTLRAWRSPAIFGFQTSGGQRFERLAARRGWPVPRKVFRGGRATARLYRLKPAPPLLRRYAETPDLEKYFRGKDLHRVDATGGRICVGKNYVKKRRKRGRFFPPSQAPPFFGKKPADFEGRKEEVFPLFQVLVFELCRWAARIRFYFACESTFTISSLPEGVTGAMRGEIG